MQHVSLKFYLISNILILIKHQSRRAAQFKKILTTPKVQIEFVNRQRPFTKKSKYVKLYFEKLTEFARKIVEYA